MSAAAALVSKSGPAVSPSSSGDSDVPLGTQALQASATSSGAKGGSKPGPKPGTKYKTRVYKVKPGPKPRDSDGNVIEKAEYAHGNYHREVLTKGTLPPKSPSVTPSPVVKHTPAPSKFPDAADLDHKRDTDLRRKHEVEQARLDGKKVATPDVKRPFSSVDDVIDRLLPYHVLASYDADELDLEQWQRDESPLLCSRAQAWKELLIGRAAEFSTQMMQQVERFNRVVRRKLAGHVPGEETLLAAKLLIEDERAKLAAEKKLRQEELDRRLEEKRAEEERRRKQAEEAERVRLEQERVKQEEERVKAEEERVKKEAAERRAVAAVAAEGSGESEDEGGESQSGERDGEGNSGGDEEESEDSDGAGILINKPSHTTDGSELVNFNNPFLGSSDWTKQGSGLKGAGYPLKSSDSGTRTTSGID